METLLAILLSVLSFIFYGVLYGVLSALVLGVTCIVGAVLFILVCDVIEWLRTGKIDQTDISERYTMVVLGVVVVLLCLLLWLLSAGLERLLN